METSLQQFTQEVGLIVMKLGELFVKEMKRDNSDMADAMRCIFDPSQQFYQLYFQSSESQASEEYISAMPEEEQNWRQSLGEGSKIDAIKIHADYGLKTWSKAFIKSVEGDGAYFVVQFENDDTRQNRQLSRYSLDIARYNSMSEGDEWRLELKAGDLIDAYDTTKAWYASTIMATELRVEDGLNIPYLKVGFRMFHNEGDKIDDEGKSYFGWSERFDEWLPAYCTRIQKFNCLANNWDQIYSLSPSEKEEAVDDDLDMIMYSKFIKTPMYATTRKKCHSTLLVEFLNKFGELGGFEVLLDQINKRGETSMGLDTLFYYMDCLTKSTIMWNKGFLVDYLPKLEVAVKDKLLTATELQLRNVKKDRIDGIVNCLITTLSSRIKTYKQREHDKNIFNLELGALFLQQNFLERRINGAKLISETCKTANISSFHSYSDTIRNNSHKQLQQQFIIEVIQLIKNHDILVQIFSKNRGHLQLVQRTEEILKLLINQNALTNEELELIWSSSQIDETTKLELYKVFNDIASRLRSGEILFIIDKLSEKKLSQITAQEIELVSEISKKARSAESAYGDKAVQFMWKLVFDNDNQLDKNLVNMAAFALTDIIKYWENDHKLKYVHKLVLNLQENHEGFLSIVMIMRILKDFQVFPLNRLDQSNQDKDSLMEVEQQISSKSEFIEYIFAKYNILEALFHNFEKYMNKVNDFITMKVQNQPNFDVNTLSDQCIADKFIHQEQLSVRLEFIKYIGFKSNVKINKEHLGFIWEQLVLKSQLQNDHQTFYVWLKEICDLLTTYKCIIELEDLEQFFREKMSGKTNAFQNLTIEGFNCVQSFFILSNESSRKLQRVNTGPVNNHQNEKFTSYNNQTGGHYTKFSFNENKYLPSCSDDVEFQVLTHPCHLEGIDGIWQIATENKERQVQHKVTQLLLKLYTCIHYELEPFLPQFEESFIQTCIDGISEQINIINQRTEEEKDQIEKADKEFASYPYFTAIPKALPSEERKILRFITLLQDIIKNSEQDGTHGLVPHSALFKGEYLHSIVISNSLKTGSRYQSKFEIACYSNTTLWQLRKIIGERVSRVYHQDGVTYFQEAPCHPSTVRIHRYGGIIDPQDRENGSTLAELRIKSNETMSVFRRIPHCENKVPLLSEKGTQLNPLLRDIFVKWFNQFSIEDPDNPGRRVMTLQNLVDFTKSCTDDNCSEEDTRVVGFFSHYDEDHDGKVQLEDFLRFYFQSCRDKEEVVRQNLCSKGYRLDLKKSANDGDEDDIMQLRKTKEDMPRYKIANNHDYFEVLFSLLDQSGEVAHTAWNLIKMLSTNPQLYQKVLFLEKNPEFQWSQVFDSSSIYRMLYSLQIIEYLLEENSLLNSEESMENELKRDWIQRFLSIGGFQEILKLFHDALGLLSNKPVDSLNTFEKHFLEFMLKMIRIFLMAALTSTQESFTDVLSLIRYGNNNIQQQEETKKQDTKNVKLTYKTPQKKVRGKFVDQIRKEINSQINAQYQPVITEEFLFGQDEENKKLEEKQEQTIENSQTTQNDDSEKKQEETKRFSDLSAIMRGSGLGELILKQINFKELQEQVLEVICLILSKKEITADDKQIIENALGLWVASLIKNNELINDFYSYKRSDLKADMFAIRNAEEFLVTGIYSYKNYRVRDEFSNTIVTICQQVHNKEGVQPIEYILDLLKRNFPREDQYYTTRECQQFFNLFNRVIEQYFLLVEKGETTYVLDEFELLRMTIEKLKRYETKEVKTSQIEDMTLIGYFTLAEKLIQHLTKKDKLKLNQLLEETKLLDDLFYENLFYTPDKTKNQENKSKTKESRAAAFSLLEKLVVAFEPKQLGEFLESYLYPMIKDLPKPNKWNYLASENIKTQKYQGINNPGCICYMISMLQQFYMVPAFRYQLLKAIDVSPENIKEYRGMQIDDSLLRQLQKMFGNLELSERQSYDPAEFCFAFKDLDGNPTNIGLQQDSYEFLNFFFDRIEKLLKPTSQQYLLEGIFGGKTCSQLICLSCGTIRNILENSYALSMPVKDRKGFEDSLQKMVEGEVINDYFCSKCNAKVDIRQRNLIAQTPNVLIVHLQRIIYNFDTFMLDKVNTRFDFPNILDLKPYSFKQIMSCEQNVEQSSEVQNLLDVPDDEYLYKLVGVNIHVGAAQHGHYYSLINTKRGADEGDENKPEWLQTEKDNWLEFNDETISSYTFNEMKVDAFGGNSNSNMSESEINAFMAHDGAGSYGKNAYMLVYERKKKTNLKEVILEQEQPSEKDVIDAEMKSEASATLECVNTATTRAVQEQSVIQDNGENSLELKVREVNYKQVLPFVPDWIKTKIDRDNIQFLIDQSIYHESFFNMLKFIFSHIGSHTLYKQYQYDYNYIPNFDKIKILTLNIIRKSMFDMLPYFYYNTQMSDFYTSFKSIIQFCDSVFSLQRGSKSMLLDFINEGYFNDNCQNFFHIMFTCPDKTARYYVGKMTSTLINKVFQIYCDSENKESPKLFELMEAAEKLFYVCIASLKTQECQKNWSRLENYFKMIQEIGTAGPYQTDFLLTKFDIVTDLIDFMLGNKSPYAINKGERRPNMGTSNNNPPFEPLVALACYLIRFSLTPEMLYEQASWNIQTNPPPLTLLGFYSQADINQNEKYPLSQNAFNMFTNIEFIDKVLKEGYECEELGKALAHFCYKNQKITKQVCKFLLKGISKNDYEKVKNYLDVVTQVSLIKDHLQRVRLEGIFGFGLLNSSIPYMSRDRENNNQIQFGIQILNGLHDEVYQYKSSLTYDSNDDALLHLLWRYKGRMDTYTVSCLCSLVNLLACDDNIAEYFSELPGPTYCYARYTDWIKPYLQEQLQDARKGYAGSLSQSKEEIVVKTLSLYEKFENYLAKKDSVQGCHQNESLNDAKMEDDDQEENVRNLVYNSYNQQPQTEIRCVPQPYIIVEVLGETVLSEEEFDDVTFTTSKVSCLYTMSRPTGVGNLSIPEKLFKKTSLHGLSRANKPQKTMEQEMQEKCINNYFWSSGVKGTNKKNYYENREVPMEQESYPVHVIEDDNKQWEHAQMNVSDIENEDEELPEKQGQYNDQRAYFEDIQEQAQVNDNQQKEQQEAEGEEEKQNDYKTNVDQPIEEETANIQWPFDIKACEDLVYKFQVSNNRSNPITVFLSFKSNSDHINLQWPRGGIKCKIYSNQSKTILLVPKIKAETDNQGEGIEIDKLCIDFQWKDKSQFESRNLQTYPAQRDTPQFMSVWDTIKFKSQLDKASYIEEEQEKAADHINDMLTQTETSDQKHCPVCTVFNIQEATVCYICDSVFP